MTKKNYKKKPENSTLNWQVEYKINNKNFLFDYKTVKKEYNRFKEMDDKSFLINIVDALHFACYVSWIKNTPTKETLSDQGLIHQLVHLLKESTADCVNLKELRVLFNKNLIINKKNIKLPYK